MLCGYVTRPNSLTIVLANMEVVNPSAEVVEVLILDIEFKLWSMVWEEVFCYY